jgi:hypothetical protein
MLVELAVATMLVLCTVLFHGFGLAMLVRVMRLDEENEAGDRPRPDPLSPRGIFLTFVFVIALFALHGAEIWFYGVAYYLIEAVPDLRTAIYFSSITYATIGYDDHSMADEWALVAAIEGINGILLLGWSTAFFVAVETRLGHNPAHRNGAQ